MSGLYINGSFELISSFSVVLTICNHHNNHHQIKYLQNSQKKVLSLKFRILVMDFQKKNEENVLPRFEVSRNKTRLCNFEVEKSDLVFHFFKLAPALDFIKKKILVLCH